MSGRREQGRGARQLRAHFQTFSWLTAPPESERTLNGAKRWPLATGVAEVDQHTPFRSAGGNDHLGRKRPLAALVFFAAVSAPFADVRVQARLQELQFPLNLILLPKWNPSAKCQTAPHPLQWSHLETSQPKRRPDQLQDPNADRDCPKGWPVDFAH